MCNRFFALFLFAMAFASNSFALNFELYNSAMMLQVTRSDNKTYICSSVAVSRTKLVTAAHCLEGATNVRVFKEYDIETNNTFYKVTNFAKAKNYNKDKSFFLFDVGVIKLGEELPANINIYSILHSNERVDELQRVGFGMRNGVNSRTVVSPILQFKFENNYIDMLDEFSYSGDSGGPIFGLSNGRFSIVGIHSTKKGMNSFNPRITSEIKAWVDRF